MSAVLEIRDLVSGEVLVRREEDARAMLEREPGRWKILGPAGQRHGVDPVRSPPRFDSRRRRSG